MMTTESSCHRNPPKGCPVILVVDDDGAICELLDDVFTHDGFRVIRARDGDEALRRLSEMHVDLMITDLVMPGREGLETISLLRSQLPQLRIIAMSAFLEPSYLAAARYLGAHATLSKPFSLREMSDLVYTMLKPVAVAC